MSYGVWNWNQKDRYTHGRRDGEMERRAETRVNGSLASGVTSKRTRGYALTFGGTEGSMLVRREWCNAVTKGMI